MTTFWQSVLNSKKAIASGVAAVITFVTATLAANGGHNLTWQQWAAAAGAYIAAHVVVYNLSGPAAAPAPAAVPAAPAAGAPALDTSISLAAPAAPGSPLALDTSISLV